MNTNCLTPNKLRALRKLVDARDGIRKQYAANPTSAKARKYWQLNDKILGLTNYLNRCDLADEKAARSTMPKISAIRLGVFRSKLSGKITGVPRDPDAQDDPYDGEGAFFNN